MAHFAKLELEVDPSGYTSNTLLVVKDIAVVADDISTSNGPLGENDMHVDGETWCNNFFGGGTWKQTSYTAKFRGRYAQIGGYYDVAADEFIDKRIYRSWSLDDNNEWAPPVNYPSSITYGDPSLDPQPQYTVYWDEPNLRFLGYDIDPQTQLEKNEFVWDPDSSSWSATGRLYSESPYATANQGG